MVLSTGGDAEATRHAAEVAARAGYAVVELDPSTLDAEVVRAAAAEVEAGTPAIWRSPWTDGEQLAMDALAFLGARVTTSAAS